MDYRITSLQQEIDTLKSGGGPEVIVTTEERASELEKGLEKTKPINNYKGSAGFKEGLKRMGRVIYEYGYRVTLARFRSLHPDSEVKEDPFTVWPEDDSVLMERQ
ncbi:hypothetical protein B296_00010706 [Ensete ventricosum]|uniref:Uncharacterized protein n=1 Tax=Ensete ventricosum TaxID=4639 RepID=A0A427AHS6_ENSVE|nr:hypothetical protein B296_00010706 [Ensete ventricosum]